MCGCVYFSLFLLFVCDIFHKPINLVWECFLEALSHKKLVSKLSFAVKVFGFALFEDLPDWFVDLSIGKKNVR